MDEVRAALPFDIRLLDQRLAATKGVELRRGEQIVRVVEADLPGHGGLERFAGFGAVGQGGAQGEDAQPGGWLQFVALVGVEQVAHAGLQGGVAP